mmetsp:Transcript_6955/g.24366  ORF Transcript_6955/g.24366 Transcript_6955/m.24366 type:complete len:266 (-) Transcript_6955:2087-2884(-)
MQGASFARSLSFTLCSSFISLTSSLTPLSPSCLPFFSSSCCRTPSTPVSFARAASSPFLESCTSSGDIPSSRLPHALSSTSDSKLHETSNFSPLSSPSSSFAFPSLPCNPGLFLLVPDKSRSRFEGWLPPEESQSAMEDSAVSWRVPCSHCGLSFWPVDSSSSACTGEGSSTSSGAADLLRSSNFSLTRPSVTIERGVIELKDSELDKSLVSEFSIDSNSFLYWIHRPPRGEITVVFRRFSFPRGLERHRPRPNFLSPRLTGLAE